MQYRPKDFALQNANVIDLNQRRCEERARFGPAGQRAAMHDLLLFAHPLDVCPQDLPGRLVDTRSDVRRQMLGITDCELFHVAFKKIQRPRLYFFLDA